MEIVLHYFVQNGWNIIQLFTIECKIFIKGVKTMVNNLSVEDCAEIVKCSEDFSYFAKTYLNLFTDAVNDCTDEEMIALLTWQCVFQNNKRLCITSTSQGYSKHYLNQVIENCFSLPTQFAPEVKTILQCSAEFQNGNRIQIVTCHPDSLRGMHICTLIIFDSYKIPLTILQKFLKNVTPIFQISTTSKLIMV